MNIEDLEEKYKDELKVLREMPQEVSDLNMCLLLKNFIATTIMPLTGDSEVLDKFMELLAVDMDSLGYSLVKQPAGEVPDSDEDQTEEDSIASDEAVNADENAQPDASIGTIG